MSRRQPISHSNIDRYQLSHEVRIRQIRDREGRPDPKNSGKPRKTYVVRWTVELEAHQKTFVTKALAEAERSKLISYQRQGIPFDVSSGLPEPMLRAKRARSWYEHIRDYADTKWATVAPNSRRSIAETLATVTPAMVATERGAPDLAEQRSVVYHWLAQPLARKVGPPPESLRRAAEWLERNTIDLSDLDSRRNWSRVRRALDLLGSRLDGTAAAPNTFGRKRAVFYNVLGYAVELGQLQANPLDYVSHKIPKALETVDSRSVVNMAQGRALLRAVSEQGAIGQRLEVFFAVMLYAALRPAEALGLRRCNLVNLPEADWGDLLLAKSTPRAGTAWTDSGTSREDRGLKHRAADDTRPVPAHPELVAIIKRHVKTFGFGPGERLISGRLGGLIGESTYLSIWRRAREAVLTADEVTSPLAARPYDLRHTAVSTWLNAGVPAIQVAEWAGHSVSVLLRVYAKCIVGQDVVARARVEEALKATDQGEGTDS